MPYTFCPRCAAKTEWAPSCSRCGAGIPLFDVDRVLKKYAVPPKNSTNAQAKSDSPVLPAIIGICMVAVVVVIVVALP